LNLVKDRLDRANSAFCGELQNADDGVSGVTDTVRKTFDNCSLALDILF